MRKTAACITLALLGATSLAASADDHRGAEIYAQMVGISAEQAAAELSALTDTPSNWEIERIKEDCAGKH